jgi:hypothetical protein
LLLAFPRHFQKCLEKPLKAVLPLLKAFENALYVRSCYSEMRMRCRAWALLRCFMHAGLLLAGRLGWQRKEWEASNSRMHAVLRPANARSNDGSPHTQSSDPINVKPPQRTHAASLLCKARCCGDSRSYRAQTMRENKSSRTKTRTQNKYSQKLFTQ